MRKSYYLLLVFLLIGLLAPLISNQNPVLLIRQNQISFPCLNEASYNKLNGDFVIMPLIPFSPGVSDFDNADYKSPFSTQHLKNNSVRYRHWLGTTLRGCDVLSGIIHGAHYALMIGFFAALLSLILGILLGSFASFLNDGRIRISILQLMFLFISSISILNIIFNVEAVLVVKLLWLILILWLTFLSLRIKLLSNFFISIYVEHIETQLNVLFSAIPRLFFVVAVMGVFKQGIVVLIVLLGFTGWMEIARMIRSELKRIQGLDYYAAAKLSGANGYRIISKQILPNILPLIISVFAFSFAGAIISEASLSFLGWGIGPEQVTWGSLIMEGRESMSAWWLIVFPGACISTCIYALISIARKWNNDIYSL